MRKRERADHDGQHDRGPDGESSEAETLAQQARSRHQHDGHDGTQEDHGLRGRPRRS